MFTLDIFNNLQLLPKPTNCHDTLQPLETPVKGSEINPKHLSKAQIVKCFSKKRHGSVHLKEGVI